MCVHGALGAAVHTHANPYWTAELYGTPVLGLTEHDICFSAAKLFFAYGLGNAGYFPFDVGASAVLFAGRPAPEAVFEQVGRHRPTLFFGVPTAYAQLLAAMDGGAAADWSSVRLCVSAGEALPATIWERWHARTGLEILDGIGSTEACHIFVSSRPGASRPNLGRPSAARFGGSWPAEWPQAFSSRLPPGETWFEAEITRWV